MQQNVETNVRYLNLKDIYSLRNKR